MRLPNFKFFNRFRLRIILQNRSSYLTLFIGIFFANVLLLFGMMMKPLLDHYQEEILKNMIAPYQYVLSIPEEPEEELLEEINALGIGPQGFGGRTTCLGLSIETAPTHVAGLPVAVNVSCHVTRRASAQL